MLKSLMVKLNQEEAEQLEEVADLVGFKVFVKKVLPKLIEARVERLLSQNIDDSFDITKLALLKSELEGARKLASDIEVVYNGLKKAK
jgi:hypothetical protein